MIVKDDSMMKVILGLRWLSPALACDQRHCLYCSCTKIDSLNWHGETLYKCSTLWALH